MPRDTPLKGRIAHRKFSTSIRSLPISSTCENRRDRPSGETESPQLVRSDDRSHRFHLASGKAQKLDRRLPIGARLRNEIDPLVDEKESARLTTDGSTWLSSPPLTGIFQRLPEKSPFV